jgi:hypothetical protein
VDQEIAQVKNGRSQSESCEGLFWLVNHISFGTDYKWLPSVADFTERGGYSAARDLFVAARVDKSRPIDDEG